MKYYSLKFTDDMPEGTGGYARAWFIRLRPKYINDWGIFEHEKFHVRQWYFTLGLHGLLYLLCKQYRLWSEVQAYKYQLSFPPYNVENKELFAKFIAEDYKLDITKEEALKRLTS